MKKTMIALVALSGLAMADTTTTDMLFSTTDGWTMGSRLSRPVATIDADNQMLYNDVCNWGQNTAVKSYTSPLAITNAGDQLDFSFVLSTNGNLSTAVTLTLIDSTNNLALVVGKGTYNNGNIQFGTTTTLADNDFYNFESVTASGTIATIEATEVKSVSGSITMNNAGKAVATFGEQTVELGESFTVDKVAISYDCATSSTQRPTMSFLMTTYTDVTPVPEPATATLSLLALAGLAARRRR